MTDDPPFSGMQVLDSGQQNSDGRSPPHGFKDVSPPHELAWRGSSPTACAESRAAMSAEEWGTMEDARHTRPSL
jgi:hypothetical protein